MFVPSSPHNVSGTPAATLNVGAPRGPSAVFLSQVPLGQQPVSTFYPGRAAPWQPPAAPENATFPPPASSQSFVGPAPPNDNSPVSFEEPNSLAFAGTGDTGISSPQPPNGAAPIVPWNSSPFPRQPTQVSQPLYFVLGSGSAATPAAAPSGWSQGPSHVFVPQFEIRNGVMYRHGEWYEGVVKRYNPTRGFGFLTATHHLEVVPTRGTNANSNDNNTSYGQSNQPGVLPQPIVVRTPVCVGDVFVHQSYIQMQGFRALNAGDSVTFRVGRLHKYSCNQAVSVKRAGAPQPVGRSAGTTNARVEGSGRPPPPSANIATFGFSTAHHPRGRGCDVFESYRTLMPRNNSGKPDAHATGTTEHSRADIAEQWDLDFSDKLGWASKDVSDEEYDSEGQTNVSSCRDLNADNSGVPSISGAEVQYPELTLDTMWDFADTGVALVEPFQSSETTVG